MCFKIINPLQQKINETNKQTKQTKSYVAVKCCFSDTLINTVYMSGKYLFIYLLTLQILGFSFCLVFK